jgi:hypothetical protein
MTLLKAYMLPRLQTLTLNLLSLPDSERLLLTTPGDQDCSKTYLPSSLREKSKDESDPSKKDLESSEEFRS